MEEETKTGPKDVFLHLLAILALYFSAGSFLALLFQYVNIFFPDPLQDNYYALSSARSIIRWSLASLIIVFPVYLLTTRYLNKIYEAEPTKRNLRIRKWLLYFTLFAAAVIIIGDLVTLVFNLLSGELTVRFILKILAVLFVAGSVFYYYYWDLKGKPINRQTTNLIITLVLAAVIAGFFVVGSPAEERLRRFDERRVQDLQFLQQEIINYWQRKEKLPESLAGLKDDIRGVTIPRDPQSGQDYNYEIRAPLTFALCATFVREAKSAVHDRYPKPAPPYEGLQNWEHGIGRVCFERTIDKDLYPPLKEK